MLNNLFLILNKMRMRFFITKKKLRIIFAFHILVPFLNYWNQFNIKEFIKNIYINTVTHEDGRCYHANQPSGKMNSYSINRVINLQRDCTFNFEYPFSHINVEDTFFFN